MKELSLFFWPIIKPIIMHIEGKAEALKALRRGEASLIHTCCEADLLTPVLGYLRLRRSFGGPWSFLLESVEGGEQRGRFSFIGLYPDLWWRYRGTQAEESHDGTHWRTLTKPPLAAFEDLLKASQFQFPASLPKMAAGLFGYFGYNTVRLVENLPDPFSSKPNPGATPESGYDGFFLRPQLLVIFDRLSDQLRLSVSLYPPPDQRDPRHRPRHDRHDEIDAPALLARGHQLLEQAFGALFQSPPALETPGTISGSPLSPSPADAAMTRETSPDTYRQKVRQAQDHILQGDVFQVVLSQAFSAPYTADPFEYYRSLRRLNPAPFLFWMDFHTHQLIGSSPEILVRCADQDVTIRPLAGTRRRGRTPEEDKRLAEELLKDPKERSEHLMLLDLARNDVGRVAQPGSVRVTDSFFLEKYSRVWHMVSEVVGKLDPTCSVLQALLAGFPAGTVSGAPKIRAMELIDELEDSPRGIYGGCVGYWSADGSYMDSCITLRTAVISDGFIHVRAGAGIVADSQPALEDQECLNKASALFEALADVARRRAAS